MSPLKLWKYSNYDQSAPLTYTGICMLILRVKKILSKTNNSFRDSIYSERGFSFLIITGAGNSED